MQNEPSNQLEIDPVQAQAPAPDPSTSPPKQPPQWRRLLGPLDKYVVLFFVLLAAVGIMTYLSLKQAKKGPAAKTTGSLTSQQVASLKGSTTIVGDSNQTLDIQGNSVFEGPVVLRKNLDVAGTLSVGGGLSLQSITIGGTSAFGNTTVNGTLAVTGNTTLQGQVSLQKNLAVTGSGSFGSLSTSQLNVSSLQLTGDLSLAHHLVTTGGAPGRSNGGALGGGGTSSVSGNDTAGTVNINTGSSPAAGCFVTINFTAHFATTPRVIISPANSAAGGIDYYTNQSADSFSICDASNPAAGANYNFNYFVAG